MTHNSSHEQKVLQQAQSGQFVPAVVQPAALPDQPAHIIRSEREALEVADLLAAELARTALERDRDRILPWKEIDQFSQSGLWGITIPQEYGGAALRTGVLAQVVERIAAADGNLGHIPQNHYYALEVLRVGATHEQKKFFYERVLSGERLGNALAEIGNKDFVRRARLIKEVDGWYVQGRKFYCTGSVYAHWIPTLVATEEPQGDRQYLVFVPRTAQGVTVTDDWDGFGQRVTGSGSVEFERVKVEPDWVIPFTSSFEQPTTIGPLAQIIHAALDLGIGRGAFEATLPFIREHARPWIDSGAEHAFEDPLLLQQVGNVHVRLRAAGSLLNRAARIVDLAQQNPTDDTVAQASIAVAEAKALATSASLLAASKLFELGGTSASLAQHGLDRFWRNARTHTLHDPVRWKYHAIGNYVLNGVRPPVMGHFEPICILHMTQSKKHIHVNAFNMNCVGHIHHGLWTHPRDRSTEYHTLKYWTDIAKILEKGLFDGIFIADVIGYYDVYQQGVDLTLREGIQLPVNNPWLLVSAMAAVTEHLGFGVTATVSAHNPYTFARDVTTLDQLTNGRIGWNIVTGYVDSGARGLGLAGLDEHDRRYDRADDFLELSYKLWEGSWEDGAVIADKARRIHALPDKVHKVVHDGPFYQANAIHMSAPSPQRTPLLFQAGTSDRGLQFAGQHAEGIFIGSTTPEAARESSRKLRQAVVNAGRQADDVKIYTGVAVVTGATEAEAKEKYADYLAYASTEGGLAHFAASTGVDFSQYDLDEPIPFGKTNAIQSAAAVAQKQGWTTRRKLLEQFKLGSRYNTIVGDANQVADRLVEWIDDGEIDGFNLTRIVVPETWEDFAQTIVPELQNRGRYRTAYDEGTLRQKLFGKGDRLPNTHTAAQSRRNGA